MKDPPWMTFHRAPSHWNGIAISKVPSYLLSACDPLSKLRSPGGGDVCP